jgi:hypothetical protein
LGELDEFCKDEHNEPDEKSKDSKLNQSENKQESENERK